MKHTKLVALFMALAMLMGMATSAYACTFDEDGNVVPCEQVEEKGYCSTHLMLYVNPETGEAKFMSNPYYDPSHGYSTSAPIEGYTENSDRPGGIIGIDTYDPANGWADDEHPNTENADTQLPTETKKPIETEKQYFPDVTPDAWYYNAVNTMAANGILNGYSDGLFHPDDYVTTGELCAIIYRLATNDNPVGKPVPGHPEYTHWAAYAVDALSGTTYKYTVANPLLADETANRGEAVHAIMSLLGEADLIDLDGVSHSDKYTQALNYTAENNDIPDWDVINDRENQPYGHKWAPARILRAYNYGIVHGKDANGRFDPTGNLTRAELCQMLANAGLTQYTPVALSKPHGYVSGG